MTTEDFQIHIIGAGVSGLVAAHILEKNGFAPTILEASDRPGGRVKTDIVKGYQLDHGFQVLLSNYPAAKRFLDYEALELQEFASGAVIFEHGKKRVIADPLRDVSMLFSTAFSGVGTITDKLKILQLNKLLKNKSLEAIFETPEQSSLTYLKDFGFSDKIIAQFFRPFFTGIFLEPNLTTSSRMFEFVFKMFGEGIATLPKSGIEAITRQLVNGLQKTSFQYDTKVKAVQDGSIVLDDGTKLDTDYTIVATEASSLIPNLKDQKTTWKSCEVLYFTTDKRVIEKPFIGLLSAPDLLVNNIFYHSSVAMAQRKEEELLSVTVVKEHELSESDLIAQVQQELDKACGIGNLTFVKRYKIQKALPNLSNLQYQVMPSETQLTDRVFLAGDVQLNGSLNAAMLSGESAALGVLQVMEKTGLIQG